MTSPFDTPPTGGPSALPPPPPPSTQPASAAPAPSATNPAPPTPDSPVAVPPPPPPPTAAAAPPPAPAGPVTPAAAPPATSGAAESAQPDDDLSDLLDRLHEDLDLEQTVGSKVGDELTDARDLERPEAERVVVETEGGIHFDPEFAGFPARAIAFLIDSVIVTVSLLPGLLLVAIGGALGVLLGLLLAAVGFCAVVAWAARSIASTGRFIGNRVARTRIVDTRTGRHLTTSSAAGRMVVRHLVSPVFLVGFFPAFADSQRRTLHDRIATSIVVARDREVWTPDDGDPSS